VRPEAPTYSVRPIRSTSHLEARRIGHPPQRNVLRERGGDALDFIATRGDAGA